MARQLGHDVTSLLNTVMKDVSGATTTAQNMGVHNKEITRAEFLLMMRILFMLLQSH
jgi:hypothetical protein